VKRFLHSRIAVVRGRAGLELFLHAYQLVLRAQCQALIRKDFPVELERLVFELWSLRLNAIRKELPAKFAEDAESGVEELFSSQPSGGSDSDAKGPTGRSKVSSIPTLEETLAICYIAALLLRVPLSVGDLRRYDLTVIMVCVLLETDTFRFRWALHEEIPYIRAIRFVPEELERRLAVRFRALLEMKVCARSRTTA